MILLFVLALAGSSFGANYESICGTYRRQQGSWRENSNSIRDRFTYILGGITTSTKDYPWMVSLRRQLGSNKISTHFCGGSIVSENHVVTAAHCVEGISESKPLVVVFYDQSERLVVKAVKKIDIHSSYNTKTNDYDIAVIELKDKLNFNGAESYLRPICLPKNNDQIERWPSCAVAGWGILNFGDKKGSANLLMSDVPIVNKNLCKLSYNALNPLTPRMFCAGDYEHGNKGTCQGDSGGPVMCLRSDRKRFQLMGITSWGFNCGKPKFPGVFTDVAQLIAFVKQQTGLD